MAKILLTGAHGQVGIEVELALLKKGHQVVSCSHSSLDITDLDWVLSAVNKAKPDVVINAAAYTNVEKAEQEQKLCYEVNVTGVANLAQACKELDIPLIHISTDYVFYENIGRPHVEDDPTSALSVYGRSKIEAEKTLIESGCKYIIVRSSWIFGRFGSNFVKKMMSFSLDRNEVAVVFDQIGNPTPSQALGETLAEIAVLATAKDFEHFGIYHYASNQATTWYDIARRIFVRAKQLNILHKDMTVIPVNSEVFKSSAQRPCNSLLDSSKIQKVFGIKLPNWEDYLDETITAWDRLNKGLSPVEFYQPISCFSPNFKAEQEQSLNNLLKLQDDVIKHYHLSSKEYNCPSLDSLKTKESVEQES